MQAAVQADQFSFMQQHSLELDNSTQMEVLEAVPRMLLAAEAAGELRSTMIRIRSRELSVQMVVLGEVPRWTNVVVPGLFLENRGRQALLNLLLVQEMQRLHQQF